MKKNYPLSSDSLNVLFKSLSLLISLALLVLLMFTINANAQCPPGMQCDFHTKNQSICHFGEEFANGLYFVEEK